VAVQVSRLCFAADEAGNLKGSTGAAIISIDHELLPHLAGWEQMV
jgi:hypothetical protein